jgi:hypothetical protein
MAGWLDVSDVRVVLHFGDYFAYTAGLGASAVGGA